MFRQIVRVEFFNRAATSETVSSGSRDGRDMCGVLPWPEGHCMGVMRPGQRMDVSRCRSATGAVSPHRLRAKIGGLLFLCSEVPEQEGKGLIKYERC
jgi:hypothetical protein